MYDVELPPVATADPYLLPHFDLWFEEEEGGGGGGAFERPADVYIYICLSGLFSEHADIGASAIKAFRDFDRRAFFNLQIKHPYAGTEDRFRDDVFSVLGENVEKEFSRSSLFAVFCDKALDSSQLERVAVCDIDASCILDTGYNDASLRKMLSELSRLKDAAPGELFDALEKLRPKKGSWTDSLELKPGLFGFKVDLKKVYKLVVR